VNTRAVEQLFARARRDVLFAGGVALVIAMVVAGLFSREVSRPIIELRDVAQAMARGDLARRPRLTAPGEVGELAAALHAMAEQLGARLLSLEAEESLLTALFESLNEGVLAVDAERRVVRMNRVGRQLLQVRGGVPFPVADLPDDAALHGAIVAALAGAASPQAELQLGDHVVMLTARPLADGGAVVALLDLTATRRLETVRSDFVANVSHELKTPLTIVRGFAETLVDDDPPAEQRRAFADTIRANAVRMQRIVDDLLDLSRIESGGWKPNPTIVDVSGVAEDAMAGVESVAAERGVALVVALAPGAREAHADPLALRQLIANLVENAVRHTSQGVVTVFSEPEDGGVWVGVRDTGVGIPPEHLPRVFERFYRVDTGRSREAGGTGLGLSIVKHLVEAHGGRVRAASTPGRGTTIAGFFPGEALVAHV
jgi:signal transduction histidine kinase